MRVILELETPLEESEGELISSIFEGLEAAGFVVRGVRVDWQSDGTKD